MKKGSALAGLMLFFVMIILLAGIGFFGFLIYNEMFSENARAVGAINSGSDKTEKKEIEIITEKRENKNLGEAIIDIFNPTTPTQEITYSEKNSTGKYFYEQLDSTQKIIYNGLQDSKEKMYSGTYTIQYGDKFSDILKAENGSQKLGDDYQAAIEAFTHDNADLFFLDVSKLYLNIETKKKAFNTTYNVYIQPLEKKNYLAKGFTSEADVSEALQKIEAEANKIKSKCTGNKAKDIKIIHDYIIENVDYDEKNEAIGTYSIYGALVEKKCVCEGYARALKYLLEKVEIENVLMQGIATNSEGIQEKHAWNAVDVNGKWYLVDATWDDPIIIGKGYVKSNVHYKYYLKGTKSFNKDHQLEYRFTDNGKEFKYPTISEVDY